MESIYKNSKNIQLTRSESVPGTSKVLNEIIFNGKLARYPKSPQVDTEDSYDYLEGISIKKKREIYNHTWNYHFDSEYPNGYQNMLKNMLTPDPDFVDQDDIDRNLISRERRVLILLQNAYRMWGFRDFLSRAHTWLYSKDFHQTLKFNMRLANPNTKGVYICDSIPASYLLVSKAGYKWICQKINETYLGDATYYFWEEDKYLQEIITEHDKANGFGKILIEFSSPPDLIDLIWMNTGYDYFKEAGNFVLAESNEPTKLN